MKKRTDKKSIRGYIEGYYGKLLSWEHRELIIKSLYRNNMNTYFYAPKEDINHRLCWKKNYSKSWRLNFRKFTDISKKYKIDIIAGLAPGLDFDFKQLNENSKTNKNSDFKVLLSWGDATYSNDVNSITVPYHNVIFFTDDNKMSFQGGFYDRTQFVQSYDEDPIK